MTCTIISTGEELNLVCKNENESPYPEIKAKLREKIWELYCKGYDSFWINCEYGVPLWCGEIITALAMYNDVELNIAMPYEEQSTNWVEEHRERFFRIHDDIIRMCTLISNNRKEYNQLDSDAFFKRYVVDDTSDNWKNYPACLTDAKIYRSKEIEGDFNLHIKVNLILKNELKSAHQIYNNVLTTGRRAFQEFAEEFELWTEDEEGIKCLDLSRLDNKVCIAKVNKANQLKGITNILLDGSAKEKEIMDFFKNNIEDAHSIDLALVPLKLKYYQDVPTTLPDTEYLPDYEYYGCIRDVDCEKVGNDINVKIAAYVFNGSNTRVIAKFFNKIKTDGKEAFDKFCTNYDIVDSDGKINEDLLINAPSRIVLTQNSKGHMYIDTLLPIMDMYDIQFEQYKTMMNKYIKSYKNTKIN